MFEPRFCCNFVVCAIQASQLRLPNFLMRNRFWHFWLHQELKVSKFASVHLSVYLLLSALKVSQFKSWLWTFLCSGNARHGGVAVGGAMSRQCHTPASSRHAHAAPLKEGAVPGSGGVSRRRVMLVDGVGRGRTAPLPPPSSRQTSMEERRLLHYLYLHYHYYLYTEYICPLTQFGQYLAPSEAQGVTICVCSFIYILSRALNPSSFFLRSH